MIYAVIPFFKKSDLTHVIGLKQNIISDSHPDMTGMKLCQLDLTGFVFSGKTLKDVDFSDTILREANFNSELEPSSQNVFEKPILKKLPTNIFKNADNDMYGIQLCGLDLTSIYFNGKKLENANFTGSKFIDAYFDENSLKGAKFKYTSFSENNNKISKTIFKDADKDMKDIRFYDMDLTGIDFTGKSLNNALFSNTNLKDVVFKDATLNAAQFKNSYIANEHIFKDANNDMKDIRFYGMELTRIDFTGKNLENADFTGSKFIDAYFHNASLKGAKFKNTRFHQISSNNKISKTIFKDADKDMKDIHFYGMDLTGIDFTGKSLNNAFFSKTNLKDVVFKGATLNAARFEESYIVNEDIFKDADKNMKDIRFYDMDLTGIDFTGKSLNNVLFSNTNLKDVVFKGATLNAAQFKKSYYMNQDIFKDADKDMKDIRFYDMDLTGIDFTGKDLSLQDNRRELVFYNSKVDNVILRQATISVLNQEELNQFNVDMTGIKIDVPNLSLIDFTGKILKDAKFIGKELTDIIFKEANLEGVEFGQSKLIKTNFIGATGISNNTFRNVKELNNVIFGDLTDINFNENVLVHCKFTRAILTRVEFGSLESNTTVFLDATLTDCTFHKNIKNLDFSNSTLNKCKFLGTLSNIKFIGANLREIDLDNAVLNNIDMTKTNLIDAKLRSTFLKNVIFVEADLIGANFEQSVVINVDFSYADLTRSIFTNVFFDTEAKSKFIGSICVGIQLIEEHTNSYPIELTNGQSKQIANQPFPEMSRNKKGIPIYDNVPPKGNAQQIHKVFEKLLNAKMDEYLDTMKIILKKELNYSIDNMIKIYLTLANNLKLEYIEPTYVVVPLNEQPPASLTDLTRDKIISGNETDGYKGTHTDEIITPIVSNMNGKVKHTGYRITNSLKGLKYRMNNIMNRFSSAGYINTQKNRNAIGSMGEFLTNLPPSLDEFKTTYLVEFINSTFYSYGTLTLECESCYQGILERVFEIFINTISVSCINDNCGDDITKIARVFGVELENKRDTIQPDTINPILVNWFDSIESDTKIGDDSKDIPDTIKQDRLLSFLKFVKTALRKETIDYSASLIGYDASVDINNYMIKNRDYICGGTLGGKRRHKRTRKIHRK